jgi:hypothetical protein
LLKIYSRFLCNFADWQTVSIGADRVEKLFTPGCNIGLRLDTLTDVDLDCPEARALAQYYLKQTSARWGRSTSRNAHFLYKVENGRAEKFEDPLAKERDLKPMLVEIRHNSGHQSMIPPSVHPDTGEALRWEENCPFKPESWNYLELRRAVGRIAAGALLSPYLKEGMRQFTWLYLSGAMKRAEWSLGDALKFVELVSSIARDDKISNRKQAVTRTFETEDEIAGLKKLEEYLPKPIIRKLAEWLDLRRTKFDPLDLTDDANAQFLFVEHGDDLRYLPNEGRGGLWVYWNDVIWQRDRMGLVVDKAAKSLKKKADQLTAESRDARFIEKVRCELLNMPGINASLDRLNCYSEIAAPSSAFDANPWLLGLFQPKARSISQPQPPSRPLFLRHFQPLAPPDPLHSILAYRPTAIPQQRGDPPVTITPVLAGQRHDLSCQRIFVGSVEHFVALCPSPLPQQPAGMPLGNPIVLAGMPDRATPPLRLRSFPPPHPSEFASPKTAPPPAASA